MSKTVTLPLYAYRAGKSAHETVAASAADNLFKNDGIEWPVSGDDTAINWGRRGMRATTKRVNVWGMVTA